MHLMMMCVCTISLQFDLSLIFSNLPILLPGFDNSELQLPISYIPSKKSFMTLSYQILINKKQVKSMIREDHLILNITLHLIMSNFHNIIFISIYNKFNMFMIGMTCREVVRLTSADS